MNFSIKKKEKPLIIDNQAMNHAQIVRIMDVYVKQNWRNSMECDRCGKEMKLSKEIMRYDCKHCDWWRNG